MYCYGGLLLVQTKKVTALPCAVIGGVTPDNARLLVAVGVNMVADISNHIWRLMLMRPRNKWQNCFYKKVAENTNF